MRVRNSNAKLVLVNFNDPQIEPAGQAQNLTGKSDKSAAADRKTPGVNLWLLAPQRYAAATAIGAAIGRDGFVGINRRKILRDQTHLPTGYSERWALIIRENLSAAGKTSA